MSLVQAFAAEEGKTADSCISTRNTGRQYPRHFFLFGLLSTGGTGIGIIDQIAGMVGSPGSIITARIAGRQGGWRDHLSS